MPMPGFSINLWTLLFSPFDGIEEKLIYHHLIHTLPRGEGHTSIGIGLYPHKLGGNRSVFSELGATRLLLVLTGNSVSKISRLWITICHILKKIMPIFNFWNLIFKTANRYKFNFAIFSWVLSPSPIEYCMPWLHYWFSINKSLVRKFIVIILKVIRVCKYTRLLKFNHLYKH